MTRSVDVCWAIMQEWKIASTARISGSLKVIGSGGSGEGSWTAGQTAGIVEIS